MKPSLRLPAALVCSVVTVTALGCSSPQPTDASAQDTAVLDTTTTDTAPVDTASADVCPDPMKCYSSFVPDDAGGAFVVYIRRDGGTSDVPCPPVPPQCPVA